MQLLSCLVDTNILIRMTRRHASSYLEVAQSIDALLHSGTQLHYTHQIAAEMWNVMTRPAERNGLGLDMESALWELETVERFMQLLPDDERTHREWRAIVLKYKVQGVKVHDANLVAAMHVHGIGHILTLNVADFRRFTDIEAVHPRRVLERIN